MPQHLQNLWFHLTPSAKPNSNSWTGLVNLKVPFPMNWWVTEPFSPSFGAPAFHGRQLCAHRDGYHSPFRRRSVESSGCGLCSCLPCATPSSRGTSSSTSQLIQRINCHSVAEPSELLAEVTRLCFWLGFALTCRSPMCSVVLVSTWLLCFPLCCTLGWRPS